VFWKGRMLEGPHSFYESCFGCWIFWLTASFSYDGDWYEKGSIIGPILVSKTSETPVKLQPSLISK